MDKLDDMKTIFERLIHFWNIKSYEIDNDILWFDHYNFCISLDDASLVLDERIPFSVYNYWYEGVDNKSLTFREWYIYYERNL